MLKENNVIASNIVPLDTDFPVWDHFFMVAPLIVVGSRDGKNDDMAPKHRVTSLGYDNYFGFVCTHLHTTYHNIKKEGVFTVSFPKPCQVVLASLAASPRCGENNEEKPILNGLPTFRSEVTGTLFMQDAYLFFECALEKIVDGFGKNSLIAGKIIGAYVEKTAKRSPDKDEQQMLFDTPLVTYLPPTRFAEIKDTYAFPFPKGFTK